MQIPGMSFWSLFAIWVISQLSVIRRKGSGWTKSSSNFQSYSCVSLEEMLYMYTHVPPCTPLTILLYLARSVFFPLWPTTHIKFPVTYFSSQGRTSTFRSLTALGAPLLVSWLAMIISVCHPLYLFWAVHGIELMSNPCASFHSQGARVLS